MKKVLIVDDEPSILELLSFHFENEEFQVTTATDGRDALDKALQGLYDFIVLDIMLPKLNGIEVCKRLRQQQILTPILMLTAKGEEVDKILGLELGADDYMTKPFSPRELLARVKVILRRLDKGQGHAEEIDEEILTYDSLKIFVDRHEVYKDNRLVSLTKKEFELLIYLAKRPGRTLSRERLLEMVWGFDYPDDTRLVDVHIGKLREKIEADTKKPVFIKTVRGFGYKFGAVLK